MYTIQDNVPKPKAHRPKGTTRRKYPFDQLEVGQMFFVPNRIKNTLTSHASTTGKDLGRKFSTMLTHMRVVDGKWQACEEGDENAVMGVAVYRDA